MQARHRIDRARRPTALVVALLAAVALTGSGCDSGEPSGDKAVPPPPAPPAAGTSSPGDIDPALLEPLTALGPCEVEPTTIDDPPAAGLVLPPGAVLTEQTQEGPLTTAKGYIPLTPVQVRVFYQRHEDLEVVQIEDEIRESEALLDNGDRRLFVKAQAICELGSVFLAVIAPRAADGQVPAPAGSAGG
jgi:hypothetical protein